MLTQFIIFNILNVIIQTVKSIATVKCGQVVAAVVNALAYGLYTYIVILTMCELSTITKAVIVALCNLVGVYVVKMCEEKARKDKLWLVKITVPAENFETVKTEIECSEIPFTYYDVNKYIVFDTYCETQKQTLIIQNICKKYNGKAFATENKLSL